MYRLILKSFLGPFLLTFVIVIFILLMQFLWRYIDDLVGKGLEFPVIAELLIYTSTSLVPMAVPLAILLASLMTMGNLAENYELIALKSSGIPLLRIMMPLIVFTVMLSIGAFFFSNNVLPISNLKMRSLLYDIQRQRPELQIKEGIFYNGIEGYSIRIGKKDSRTDMLYDIRIYDHTERKGNVSITRADSGIMKLSADERYLILTLYSGNSYTEMESDKKRRSRVTYPHRRDHFMEQKMMIELSGFGLVRTDQDLFKSHYQMMNLGQLQYYEDSLKDQISHVYDKLNRQLRNKSYLHIPKPKNSSRDPGRDSTNLQKDRKPVLTVSPDSLYASLPVRDKKKIISLALNHARSVLNFSSSGFTNSDGKIRRLRKYQIEIQRKFTLSFACFIFFFIGAPLGAIIRKGGLGMPVVVSVFFFLLYYIISLTGEKFVRESILPACQGMWISSLILLPLGVFLTYKATTDSVIMNIDTYFDLAKKYLRWFRIFGKKTVKKHEPAASVQ